MVFKRIFNVATLCLLIGLLCFLPSAQAISDDITLPGLVSENPADWTPEVPGTWGSAESGKYEVRSLAPQGTKMYAGGYFPVVTTNKGDYKYNRSNIFAFDAKSGAIDQTFKPVFDKPVNVIAPSLDGKYLYVGGEFKSLNGQNLNAPFIVKLD